MAVTISLYNASCRRLAAGEVSLSALRLMLVDGTTAFDASHSTLAAATDSGADEVDGNGWDAGGETLSGVSVSTVTTNDAKLDANDLSVTATGGSIGPAAAGILYDDDDADDAPLAYIDFDGSQEAEAGADFKVTWNAAGIFTFTVA